MNTPPTKKRFSGYKFGDAESGTYSLGLNDPKYQAALGVIVSSYEHLETAMPTVLAVLLGTGDAQSAGYACRSIRNPRTRGDLMWKLLESAPHNREAPPWFDDVLRAYDSIKKRRNEYVHGVWTTRLDDNTTLLARFPEHDGWLLGEAKREPLDALQTLINDIHTLIRRIQIEGGAHVAALRKQQQEQAQKDAQRQTERISRRAAKAARPQPQSSDE